MSQEKSTGAFGGFIGALKGALFEDDSLKSEKPVSAAAAPASAAGQGGAAPPSAAPMAAANLAPQVNPMVAMMMQSVMGRATAYTALQEALAPLEKYIPDEASRYKAAFDIVGKTRSIEQIVQAIEMQHMQALQNEAQRFTGQAQGKQDEEITARMKEAEGLRLRITAAQDEAGRLRKQTEERLKALEGDIAGCAQTIESIEQEVSTKRAAIERVNAQFNAAVEAVKDHLMQAKAKVLKHLAG